MLALAAPGCGTSSSSGPGGPATCQLTSDCAAGLVCAIGRCRAQCMTDVDCGGGTCVFGVDKNMTKGFFCQAPADKNKPCASPVDCKSPMACASDYRCRNLCASDADCNPPGASVFSKVCAQDANGVDYCASPADVSTTTGTNMISAAPPAGAMTDAAVVEPSDAAMIAISSDAGMVVATSGASSGGSGSSSGAASGSASGAAAGSASGAATGSASGGATGSASGAPTDAGKTCAATCPNGQACDTSTGMCAACGSSGQPCCPGNPCGANLVCGGTQHCECGNANEPCCGGNGGTCNNNITCQMSDAGAASSCVCGQLGTACCPAVGGGAATCKGTAYCAGKACGCVVEYQPVYYGYEALARLVDGTLRKISNDNVDTTKNNKYQQVVSSAGAVHAAAGPGSIAVSGSGGTAAGCAIAPSDGSVWCFPLRDTLADSTYLGVGGGPGSAVSQAQQVWTSVDGSTKLAGAVQIAGGGNSYPSFCAVDGGGNVWCWGYNAQGELGTGDASTLPTAAKVKTALTATFGGAAEVRVGIRDSCARKAADGSIWCWGDNVYGGLGVSPSTQFVGNSNYYPNKVVITGTATAAKLMVGPTETFCAVMSDTSVLCWGYNGSGEATAPTSSSAPPTTILQAAGGAPLTTVVDVVADSNASICARVTGGQVYCWGSDASNAPYPVPRKDNNNVAISTILSPLYGSYNVGLSYVDRNGQVAAAANATVTQPVCDNGAGQ